jgi:hypothetical protein
VVISNSDLKIAIAIFGSGIHGGRTGTGKENSLKNLLYCIIVDN